MKRYISPPLVEGCNDSTACNYNVDAKEDDGSCIFKQGCNEWCEGDALEVQEIDCNDVCGGIAIIDSCSVCSGGTTSITPCNQDCSGTWGGLALVDSCGNCDDDISNDCVQDCEGTWGGNIMNDECGVCGGEDNNNDNRCQIDQDFLEDLFTNNENLSGYSPDASLGIWTIQYSDGRIIRLAFNDLFFIPESIGNLSSLESLSLYGNFNLQPIPTSIGNLVNLTYLKLSNSRFSGVIPSEIGNLTNLTELDLQNNKFTSLPESIGNLINLVDLRLLINELSSLPNSIGNLSSLELLWLQNNQLTTLPESIVQLSRLKTLNLSSNNLTILPDSIIYLNCSNYIDLSSNNLTDLPEYICSASSIINVSNNSLCQFSFSDCLINNSDIGLQDCSTDCAGTLHGDAVEDNCNTCDNDPENDCLQDCAGTWGGDLVDDECGICGGDNSPSTGTCDCEGTPNGSVVEDCAGVCNGTSVLSGCDNVCNSTAVEDCAGVCGGTSVLSGCDNVCNSTAVVDCAGVCGGSVVEDCAGLCGGTATGCSVYDIDGNGYTTVIFDAQEWLVQNLKTTKYKDGSPIPTGYSNSEWVNLSTGAYSVYPADNDSNSEATCGENCVEVYGNLYNWYAVDDSRDVCPDGYHVPTNEEFRVLTDYLGGESVAGGKMKETGLDHWNSPNTGATNESGFTGLPAGYRDYSYGYYSNMGNYGFFWSSSESSSVYAWYRGLGYEYSNVTRYGGSKHYGFSVRCLGD